MKVTLRVWRQAGPEADGSFEEHDVDGVNEEMSFLEMMDVLNDRLVESGDEPIEFESDCREGICGTCNLVIDPNPPPKTHTKSRRFSSAGLLILLSVSAVRTL